jgi:hypothetical protein
MQEPDIIIVGSGCSGAMAAQTLVESGVRVLMLDVGAEGTKYKMAIPQKDFESIRRTEKNQHNYFLGEDFESLNFDNVSSGAQLTPPRKHIVKHVNEYLSILSDSFSPVESLALGGLGAGWGLGCCVYSKEEMQKCKLDATKMESAYEEISARVGVSADSNDNAAEYTIGKIKNHLSPLKLDETKYLLDRFSKKTNKWNKRGLFLGRPALALLSEDYQGRKATMYDDMHFYRDAGNSAYRPSITIDYLKTKPNFSYIKNQFVLSFVEEDDFVKIETFDIEKKERREFYSKKLVLAAGALSTARIVLRSFNSEKRLSFLCNPYTYYPCLNPLMAGKRIMQNKTGLAQVSIFHDEGLNHTDIAMASIYSYRSLFLFRLMNDIPLNYRDGKDLMRFLLSGMLIMGVHHPDEFNSDRFMLRVQNKNSLTGDDIKMEFASKAETKSKIISREKIFTRLLRSLGAWSLKRVEPAMGASIHYAGTLPYSKEEKGFTLSESGKLSCTKNVYVADSSGFNFLPAKGLTFSLMANAHVVAKNILKKNE